MNEFLPGTGLFDAPPDEKGEPEYNLAKRAKAQGMTAKQYLTLRSDGLRLTARVLNWDSGMMDQAVLALSMIIAEVWGPIS